MTQNKNEGLASKEDLLAAIYALDSLEDKKRYNKVSQYFTDTGPNARSKYPKQMELMEAGIHHRLRAFIGGNGSGKSLWASIESYYHMSGLYPAWWKGHRFNCPIDAWLCGRETKILRDGLQEILFGGIGDDDIGSGIIPRKELTDDHGVIQKWAMAGTSNCIGQFRVRHYTHGIFDGWSKCEFKTYAQGWAEFQGPTRQWIVFDEEPDDEKIFAECVARLRGKDGNPPGHFLAAFTPTAGLRTVYLSFVPNGVYPENGIHPSDPSKFTARVGWSASPHLDEEWKRSAIENWKLTDPTNIEARTEGYAAMGSGRVYPIDEQFVVIPKVRIPDFWPKAYGMDPGQANFACVWVAMDPNTGVKYVYDEYKHGHVNYILHVEAIKNRGEWIAGGIDPHEAVKPRDDGDTVQNYFESHNLSLVAAKGDPDALRIRIRAMLDSGSLKITDNCTGIIGEIRTYRYDANDPNKIARNQEDHRLDALLYCIASFDSQARSHAEVEEETYAYRKKDVPNDEGRSSITGY